MYKIRQRIIDKVPVLDKVSGLAVNKVLVIVVYTPYI